MNGVLSARALGSMIKPTKKMYRIFFWRPGDAVYTMLPYVMHLLGHGRLPRGAAGWRHVVARHSTTQHVVPWRATRSSSQHDGATHCASGTDQSSTYIRSMQRASDRLRCDDHYVPGSTTAKVPSSIWRPVRVLWAPRGLANCCAHDAPCSHGPSNHL